MAASFEDLQDKLERRGHEIRWLLAGRAIRHGVCTRCGADIVYESRGAHSRVGGTASLTACNAVDPRALPDQGEFL